MGALTTLKINKIDPRGTHTSRNGGICNVKNIGKIFKI
jgi:hypothetical protein